MQPKVLLFLALLVAENAVASDPQASSTTSACIVFQTVGSFNVGGINGTSDSIIPAVTSPSTQGLIASAIPSISARTLLRRQSAYSSDIGKLVPSPSVTSSRFASTVTAVVTKVAGGSRTTVYPSGITPSQYSLCSSTTTTVGGPHGTGTPGPLSTGNKNNGSMKNRAVWAGTVTLLGGLAGMMFLV
ncbi:hypothetical protein CPB83DRAFT_893122 [Crepidotus variabilis]|uniref:Uncharacterized protein n=1 Tax=Crepidotus variabilis TaxID=179855 RepID=A0A9P6JRM2_9AGAR|nr:hypothetical protein CPB83DRAFT_893122 [Crepidotus variabilis]